jgi:pimeloyl-ACP methyl ester carboxylesterase
MATRVYRVVVGAIALTLLAACAADNVGDESDVVELQRAPLKLRRECKDNPDDIYKPVGGNQAGALGDVVRCAKSGRLSTQEITQALADRTFVGIDVQKAVKLFRISYRTQRLAGKADLATALVALPARNDDANRQGIPEEDDDDEDKLRSGNRAPLIVFAHGTAPPANHCASSKLNLLQCSTTDEHDTELVSIAALAAQGYPVIAPDYAGYVEGSRTQGYLLSEDEAHSILDATRAMNKLRQKTVDKVVFVGHSQGGHAVLSAQALARSYGLSGQLVGVAAMAPFWATARLFGVFGSPKDSPFAENPVALAFIIQYFYSHAEVYDGPGNGKLLFNPAVASLLPDYINTCEFNAGICNFINLPPAGFGLAPHFLETNFYTAMLNCGRDKAACDTNPLSKKWEKRFKADRPKLDRNGAPIVLWHGAFDAVVPTPLAGCANDKITSDLSGTNKYRFCGDLEADHDQILSRDLAWVTRWIDARALGTPEPAPQQCVPFPTFAEFLGPDFSSCLPISAPVNLD